MDEKNLSKLAKITEKDSRGIALGIAIGTGLLGLLSLIVNSVSPGVLSNKKDEFGQRSPAVFEYNQVDYFRGDSSSQGAYDNLIGQRIKYLDRR